MPGLKNEKTELKLQYGVESSSLRGKRKSCEIYRAALGAGTIAVTKQTFQHIFRRRTLESVCSLRTFQQAPKQSEIFLLASVGKEPVEPDFSESFWKDMQEKTTCKFFRG